jgi:Bacterial transcriptional activator domain/Bacterial extracellular solute-binding proteins, family 5 Middle
MLALYRSGRQAEALDAYQRARRTLVDDLGIEPGQPLQQLEAKILNQDPALDRRPAAGRPSLVPRTRRSRASVLAACALALAIAAAFVLSRGGGSQAVPANAVGVIESGTGRLAASIAVGPTPSLIAYGGTPRHRQLWVANAGDQTLTRIDTATRKPSGPVVSLRATPAGLAVGFGAVWVLDKDVPQLLRVDPEVGRVVDSVPLPLAGPGYFPAGIVVGARSVWAVYDSPGQLVRVDPILGRVVKKIAIGSPTAIAYGAGAVWIGGPYDGVTRVDPSTNSVRHRAHLPHNTVTGVAVGGGYVWATIRADDLVWQLDTDGNIERSFETGSGPAGVTVAGEVAWIANGREGTITRVDPGEPDTSKRINVGNRPTAIVAVPGANGSELWVAVDERLSEPLPPPNGARIVFASETSSSLTPSIASVDPAIAFSLQSYQWEYATAAKLFNYPDAMPPVGLRPQPELAAGPPHVSEGGTTYRFRIRSGFRFSPPSSELVTAATVRDSIERALSPKLGSNAPGMHFADVISGAAAYHAGTAAHVTGLTANGDALTIRLTRPVGDLLHRLALPIFSVVPRNTPVIANGLTKPIPSAGPYYVQYLPPGMPGSLNDHVYPLARPDLATAKALARGRGGRAVLWTCNLPICLQKAEIIRRNLAPLGIRVAVKSDFPVGGAGAAASKRGARFDLTPLTSTPDLADPGNFLRSLFDGRLIRAAGNTNLSYFNDPVVNARLARADRLSGRGRERAFGPIAADLARDQAPIAVFSQPYQAELVSTRLACLIHQPAFGGLDLAALCIRGKP